MYPLLYVDIPRSYRRRYPIPDESVQRFLRDGDQLGLDAEAVCVAFDWCGFKWAAAVKRYIDIVSLFLVLTSTHNLALELPTERKEQQKCDELSR